MSLDGPWQYCWIKFKREQLYFAVTPSLSLTSWVLSGLNLAGSKGLPHDKVWLTSSCATAVGGQQQAFPHIPPLCDGWVERASPASGAGRMLSGCADG